MVPSVETQEGGPGKWSSDTSPLWKPDRCFLCFKWGWFACSLEFLNVPIPVGWRKWGRSVSTLLCSPLSVSSAHNSLTSLAAAPKLLKDVTVLSTWRWRQLKWPMEDSNLQRDLYPLPSPDLPHTAPFPRAWGLSPHHRWRLLLFSVVPSEKIKILKCLKLNYSSSESERKRQSNLLIAAVQLTSLFTFLSCVRTLN